LFDNLGRRCVAIRRVCVFAAGTCVLLCGFLSARSQSGLRTTRATAKQILPDIIFVESPIVVAGDLLHRFPQGSRLARLHPGVESAPAAILTPSLFAVGDPQLSFDGARVIFSAQKAVGERWQIWEMKADGSGQRQVTHCPADCLRPAYLPNNEIVYAAASTNEGRTASHLMVSKSDGSDGRRITFGPGDFQVETVLRNGLILTSAPWPLRTGEGAADSREFYTIKPDGTALESFRCEHEHPAIRAEAEELEDGSIVFVKRSSASKAAGGELAHIRRGAAHNAPLGPPQVLTWSSRQSAGNALIVSRWLPLSRGVPGRFDLYLFDLKSGVFGERIYGDPQFSSIQAVPVTARPVPGGFWSLVNPEAKAGYFICLNSYLSGDDPKGRFSTPVARVRVLALEPASGQESALGEAPVEKDGSFYVSVPPDQPVRFELLDPSGETIHAQRSWVWARPGEERGCPGCHEDKAIAPDNHWPLTLRRFDTPTRLGVMDDAAAKP